VSEFVGLIEKSIRARGLFSNGQKILVGVSGGVDSMVLLEVLRQLSATHDLKLIAAHFNHQLRGRSSDADEKFVRQAAERLGIPFVAGRRNVKAFAQQQNISIEMAARRLRHKFFGEVARKKNVSVIALGHHADDQAELFFLRLLRGAGPEGLSGMKWSNPSPADPKILLARPLLGCSRSAIHQFAREEKINFREEKTNLSLDFLRNRVRHQLLPLLIKDYQPSLSRTIARVMELLQAESDFVADAAASWSRTREPAFDALPVALQRRSLQMQIFELGLEASFDAIEHLRLRIKAPVTLRPGTAIYRDASGRVHIFDFHESNFDKAHIELELTSNRGAIVFAGVKIRWDINSQGAEFALNPLTRAGAQALGAALETAGCESFDADKVGSPIALRHWVPGDRFQPIGMRASVKLQDLFCNQKIPRSRRHKLVVAATAAGELFWVQGLLISEKFKLDPRTARRLNWGWESS